MLGVSWHNKNLNYKSYTWVWEYITYGQTNELFPDPHPVMHAPHVSPFGKGQYPSGLPSGQCFGQQ